MEAKKRILVIAGAGVACAALLGTLVWLQKDQIEKLRTEVAEVGGQIDQARAKIGKTNALEREVILRRETDEVARRILPNDQDILNFVRTLSEFESHSGVKISSIDDLTKSSTTRNKKETDDFAKVAYKIKFEANAFQMLDFLDRVESHERLMRVPSFKLTAAKRDSYDAELTDEALEARHSVEMEVETYVYRPRSASSRVDIEAYERKRDLLATEISARQREMTIPAYDYKGDRQRRDPWVDPRMPANLGPGELVLSIEEQIYLVEDLVARTQSAVELLEKWRQASNLIADIESRSQLEKALTGLEEEARRVEGEGRLLFLPAKQRFRIEVLDEITRIRRSLAETDDLQVPIAVLRQAVETMHSHLELSEYELALEAYAGIEGRLAAAENDPQREPYVTQLREYEHMAKAVLEFAKLPLDVRGVVDLGPDKRVALINGRTFAPGELVAPDLLLVMIERDQLGFVYQGVKLTRPLSQ
jgi:Tfp pilus assembly protein PilO